MCYHESQLLCATKSGLKRHENRAFCLEKRAVFDAKTGHFRIKSDRVIFQKHTFCELLQIYFTIRTVLEALKILFRQKILTKARYHFERYYALIAFIMKHHNNRHDTECATKHTAA